MTTPETIRALRKMLPGWTIDYHENGHVVNDRNVNGLDCLTGDLIQMKARIVIRPETTKNRTYERIEFVMDNKIQAITVAYAAAKAYGKAFRDHRRKQKGTT